MTNLRAQTLTRPTNTLAADTDGDWRNQAACASTDPEVFFIPELYEDAARVCAGCPVVAACLEAALNEEGGLHGASRFGVRGALDPEERATLSRKMRRAPAPPRPLMPITHGTARGYAQHRRRSIPACEPWLTAERVRQADAR